MLRNAPGFASDNACITDRVEKRRFTVINVTHDGHDRCARLKIFFLVFNIINDVFDIGVRDAHNLMAKLFNNQFGGIGIDHLVLGRHDTVGHQGFHYVCNALRHAVGQFGHHNGFRQLNITHDLFTVFGTSCFLALAFLLSLHGSE